MKNNLFIISLFFSFYLFSQSNKVISGPMISYIDSRTTQLWMLLEPNAKMVQLEVRSYDNDKFLNYDYKVKNPYKFKNYIPVTIPIESLRPNTEFELSVWVDSVKLEDKFDIYTTRPHLDDTHFLIGGDVKNLNNDTDDIFYLMKKMNSDFMVWTGNNIYSNLNKESIDFRKLVDRYVSTRSNEALNSFLKSTPQIATWDDVDYGLLGGGYEWAFKDSAFYAFNMFWPNSLNKTYNYTFWDYGVYQRYDYNDIDVFLLDARVFREKTDDKSPSLFGDTQIERLFQEINNNGATFTFLVSPTPFMFDSEESLINYQNQLEHFMYRLKVSGTEGVILLSGNGTETEFKKYEKDPNWSDMRFWHPIYEFNFGSIAGDSSQNFSRIKVEGKSEERVCVIETFDANGNRVFLKRIHEDELKF